MKTPKPLRAFALVRDEGRGHFACSFGGAVAWINERHAQRDRGMMDEVVPVTISAGDTAAEVRRLRRALGAIRRFVMNSELGYATQQFLVTQIDAALARKVRRNGDQREGGIAWTDQTWNPTRGCTRVSEGCRNCYAETVAARFSDPGQPYEGLATRGPARWTGKLMLVEEHLTDPLRWKRPRRVFVNSMSDLFHEKVPDEWIDRVFAVMALSPRHTFQVLTKRPERMRAYLSAGPRGRISHFAAKMCGERAFMSLVATLHNDRYKRWPLPNVWLGVSVEDQATADARIPLLLQTPAAVRFVSYEPALGPVDFESFLTHQHPCMRFYTTAREKGLGTCTCRGTLSWLICGGESGPGARPFDVAWARSTIAQCRAAGVACFVKQLGARPTCGACDGSGGIEVADDLVNPCDECDGAAPDWKRLRDRKGGDPSEWPEDLDVREFPAVRS